MLSGYADDVCVMTGSRRGISAAKNNETVLKRLEEWLSWSQSMKAKPKKCIAAGLIGGKVADPGEVKTSGGLRISAITSSSTWAKG